jgi:TPR repeat protein
MLFCRAPLFTFNAIGLLGLVAFVMFSFTGPAVAEISLAEAQGRYANSTVFIAIKYETFDGQPSTSGCKKGSGFIISESGYVVTSYHLFTDEKHRPFDKINAKLGKVGESFDDCDQPLGEAVRLESIMPMAEVDAVLLKIVSPKRYVPIPACLGSVVANGSPLYVLGFPLGLPLASQQVTKGNDTGKQWQISGQFDRGASGGPVISPRGTLVGLVLGGYERTNISYVVPLNHFSSFFQIAGLELKGCAQFEPKPAPTPQPSKSQDVKDDQGIANLKLAVDQGNADAQAFLGTFYRDGLGGLAKDDREAARLFKLAANKGNSFGQAYLGDFYADGRGGLTMDTREAARLLKLAADQGNPFGQAFLGNLYAFGRGSLPKDEREAARLDKLAAGQGNPFGQAYLADLYTNGRGGLTKDPRESARLFKLAAEQFEADQGNADAQTFLGIFYRDGRGVTKDERKAVQLFKLAAEGGNAEAQVALGVLYTDGRGGLSKDEREAARLFTLAADQQYPFGQAALGDFHRRGRGGLQKNPREATRLFKLAADQFGADQGNPEAQAALADLYMGGLGVPKDQRKATDLFKLAANGGNAYAKTVVKRLSQQPRTDRQIFWPPPPAPCLCTQWYSDYPLY